MKIRLCCLLLLFLLASGLNTNVASAAPLSHVSDEHQHFIVVRLEKVWVFDDQDPMAEGEIQYLGVVATGDVGEEPIVAQRTGFPLENWYEAEDGSTNAVFLGGQEKAIPLFAFPEEEMGDELVISFTVVDDDEVSALAIDGHRVAATIATAVTTAMAGPGWGGLVGTISGAVQDAIEEGADLDFIGTHTNRLRRSDNFGMAQGEHSVTIDVTEGDIRVRYTVMRVTVREEHNEWCVSMTLNRVRIMEDSDGFWEGEGDIYIRARVADGYVGEVLRQQTTHLPADEYEEVDSGDDFPTRNQLLYFNECDGLPPFLYTEVDVFEDDGSWADREQDDVLGVLPLMYTNRWLREHPGSHRLGSNGREYYQVTGADPSASKARIYLTLEIWDPNGPID